MPIHKAVGIPTKETDHDSIRSGGGLRGWLHDRHRSGPSHLLNAASALTGALPGLFACYLKRNIRMIRLFVVAAIAGFAVFRAVGILQGWAVV